MNKFMKIAKERSINGCRNHEGGPFGAVIVDKEGNVIAEGNNRVLCDLDPTAHAEVTTMTPSKSNFPSISVVACATSLSPSYSP